MAARNTNGVEEGTTFTPRFNDAGLIPAIVVDARSQSPLMFAYMDAQALKLTIETRQAHFYSRSRKKLWKKGETSGQVQKVERIRTDCDQDVIVLDVTVTAEGAVCHTGRATCFYREVTGADTLAIVEDERLIDPSTTYSE